MMNPETDASPAPVTAPWAQAAAVIAAAARQLRTGEKPLVVGITGPVGSGKSTLAARLSPCVIATDDYLPDYEDVQMQDADRPEMADLEALARDLRSLRDGRRTRVPIWSFKTHRRESMRDVEPPTDPAGMIVCEGIHALHTTVHAVLDLAVFVEAPADVRWKRWEVIEQSGQRGWGVERARRFFNEVAEPTYAGLARDYRNKAHVVVVNPIGW
jgi:uridine kinase